MRASSVGRVAGAFTLSDMPHSRVSLDDYRGRSLVLIFYVADWHPTAIDQLRQTQSALPSFDKLGASIVGISTDTTWSHHAFAQALGLDFPLLSDDSPPGAVAAGYRVKGRGGRSRRATFVIDGQGIVRWGDIVPDEINPGIDGLLSVLERLHDAAA